MPHEELIIGHFQKEGISETPEINKNPESNNRYYVFVPVHRNKRGHQRPSKFKLNRISSNLNRVGIIIDFILVDGAENDVPATLKTALDYRFQSELSNLFVDSASKSIVIWIEPKRFLSPEKQDEIAEASSEILDAMGVAKYKIQFTTGANLATPTAVLTAIRHKSPVLKEAIIEHLKHRKLEVPNEEWMDRMLDRIRKSGRIVRLRSTGEFVLTLKGLTVLGSRKDRHSPDVVRALALARRES